MPKVKPQIKSTKGLIDGIKNLVIENRGVKSIPQDMWKMSGGALNLGETPVLQENLKLRKPRINPFEEIYKKLGFNENDINERKANKMLEKNVLGTTESNLEAVISRPKLEEVSQEDKDYFRKMKDNYYNSQEFKNVQEAAMKRKESVPTSEDTDSFQEYLEKMMHQDLNKYMNIYKGIDPGSIVNLIKKID